MVTCIPNDTLNPNPSTVDSRIIHENKEEKVRVHRVTQEAFGSYPQPQLEFAQYKVGWCSGRCQQVRCRNCD